MKFLMLLLVVLSLGCSSQDEETCQELGGCELGVECSEDGECTSGLCSEVCAQPCQDEQECPEGQGCRFHSFEGRVDTICAEVQPALGDLGDSCRADDACRGGLCYESKCTELCTECVRGAYCRPVDLAARTVGLCQWAPAKPSVSEGPFVVELSGTEEIQITIPAGLASFTIVIRHSEPGGTRRVGVASLLDPAGQVLENGDLDTSDINPAGIRYPDAATILVPVSDTSGPPVPGAYTLTAKIWDIAFEAEDPFVPATGEVFVDVTYEWLGEEGGLLDLNLFVSPATALSLDVSDPYIAETLDVLKQHFAGAGVALGEVTIQEMSADYDAISTSDAARDMCRQLSVPGTFGAAVNVFLVANIEFGNALGFTGGSPSAPGHYGLASSGVVVEVGDSSQNVGVVLAHELGHFLSLQHTTAFNQDGSVFGTDSISDTAECADAGDVCEDRENLMFPTIDFGLPLVFSPGQLEVIARNPTLYELMRPDLCASNARDVTQTRQASGFLSETGSTSGSCGGAGGEVTHVIRVQETTSVEFQTDEAHVLYLREADCVEGAELGCSDDGVLALTLEPGEYFLVVDGEEAGAYGLVISE